jgi:glyceraldehyde-3-phosphate dehydrogenase/erythrose-4-phosphate dehydrogenase
MNNRVVNVAIVGLGRIGSIMLKKFLEREAKGVKVLAVSEKLVVTEGVRLARERGIPVYENPGDIAKLGSKVDLIFELTGVPRIHEELTQALNRSGNRDTIIVPNIFAHFVWNLIAEG